MPGPWHMITAATETGQTMSGKTLYRSLAAACLLLAVLAAGWILVLQPRMQRDLAGQLGQGDYALQTTGGGTFTRATLEDGPTAVFFGFTHCPEVCPTTLGDISQWQAALQDEGRDPLDVYFVTVDPERDTLELLDDYTAWAPGVQVVTGPRAEIDKAIRAFKVYASRVPLEGGGYTMDHSAFVLLFDGNGRFTQPISYQEDTDRAMAKLRAIAGG